MDIMSVRYGVRKVEVIQKLGAENQPAPLGMQIPETPSMVDFDFSILRDVQMGVKQDVGASSYWSEIANMQTLDNLLMNKHINAVQYLERMPNGYVAKKQALIAELKAQQGAAMPPVASGTGGNLKIATIKVSGVSATPEIHSSITAGMRGATVSFEYTDPMWDGLVKNVTFQGAEEKTILNAGETVAIPSDTVSEPNQLLMVGVVGVEPGGNVVIPTIWTEIGIIRSGAYVSEDSPEGDSPAPIWIQQQAMIGDLRALLTGVKSNGKSFVRTYSDSGYMVERNGTQYSEAIDPADLNRVYTETDELVEGYAEDATVEDYQNVLREMGVEV